MKDFRVSYYLGDMFHSYIVEADNEFRAINKVMRTLASYGGIMHDFKIEKYVQEWN